MSSHVLTWKSWLRRLTPANVSPDALESIAQGLSYAAPNGPRGFECCDDCRCEDTSERLLTQALLDSGHPAAETGRSLILVVQKLRRVITLEGYRPLDLPTVEALCDWRTIVSRHSTRVSHARQRLPGLWSLIEAAAQ